MLTDGAVQEDWGISLVSSTAIGQASDGIRNLVSPHSCYWQEGLSPPGRDLEDHLYTRRWEVCCVEVLRAVDGHECVNKKGSK